MQKNICFISNKECLPSDLVKGANISYPIFIEIQNDYKDFTNESFISTKELYKYRQQYIENIVKKEIGDVTDLENEVIEKLNTNKFISGNKEPEISSDLTYGQKLADKIASFGGSWKFIISFITFMFIWICINISFLTNKAFDPYPFILLNLILSCLAALQAPVIMMSQNRQEEKDRIRNEHDYQVNLAAELQIRLLHEKMDHQMLKQHDEMIAIQKMQIELMEELANKMEALEKDKYK